MASTEIRDRRRTLRYRNLMVRQVVQMKNRISGLLMESGVSYDKQRLHKMGFLLRRRHYWWGTLSACFPLATTVSIL
jgi:transposase